ncbi:MAG: hypothetical protein ACXVIG_08270 [Halobacteriota archaeon]
MAARRSLVGTPVRAVRDPARSRPLLLGTGPAVGRPKEAVNAALSVVARSAQSSTTPDGSTPATARSRKEPPS